MAKMSIKDASLYVSLLENLRFALDDKIQSDFITQASPEGPSYFRCRDESLTLFLYRIYSDVQLISRSLSEIRKNGFDNLLNEDLEAELNGKGGAEYVSKEITPLAAFGLAKAFTPGCDDAVLRDACKAVIAKQLLQFDSKVVCSSIYSRQVDCLPAYILSQSTDLKRLMTELCDFPGAKLDFNNPTVDSSIYSVIEWLKSYFTRLDNMKAKAFRKPSQNARELYNSQLQSYSDKMHKNCRQILEILDTPHQKYARCKLSTYGQAFEELGIDFDRSKEILANLNRMPFYGPWIESDNNGKNYVAKLIDSLLYTLYERMLSNRHAHYIISDIVSYFGIS